MASQKDNLAELAKLGVTTDKSDVEGVLPLKGDESAADVAAILKNVKAILKDAKDAAKGNQNDENDGALLVWVKGRTYINETERVDGGLYRLTTLPDRLAKSPTSVVEVFADGSIPPRKLTEIAKWSGIDHPEDYKDEDELLAKIVVADFKPF